jgi:hypothetical protein
MFSCSQKEPTYYLYDYYDGVFLVMKNAVTIERTWINDSISQLDITNHIRKRNKGRECMLRYANVLYQKNGKQGIYYSQDGNHYELYYSYDSTVTVPKFQIFDFYVFDDMQKVKLIKNIELDKYNYRIYQENDLDDNITIFSSNIDLPLFGKNDIIGRYYQLSKIAGNDRGKKIEKIVDTAKKESSIFGSIGTFEGLPYSECYIEALKEAVELKKQGYSNDIIFKRTGISEEELLKYISGNQ